MYNCNNMTNIFKVVLLIAILVVLYLYLKTIQVKKQVSTNTNNNLKAFQMLLRYAEFSRINDIDYRSHFGFSTFTDTSRHPNKKICISGYCSTAAGAFQYINSTWVWLAGKYGVRSFTQRDQDYINELHLTEMGVKKALDNNDLQKAVEIAGAQWASLPGSKFGQGKHSYQTLEQIYIKYGGSI